MRGLILSDAELRRVLDIHFCPTCVWKGKQGVDTMPSELTGQCFWCGTQLIEPNPNADLVKDRLCSCCGGPIAENKQRGTEYCSEKCRRRHWRKRNPAPRPPRPAGVCRHCGGEIPPPKGPGRAQAYCSDTCRKIRWKQLNEARRAARISPVKPERKAA